MKKLLTLAALFVGLALSAQTKAQTDTILIKAPQLASDMKVCVTLPKQLVDNPESDVRYPVVYLLNGYSGGYADYPTRGGNIDSLATVYETIIVCPDGRDSWYWDSPVDPAMQMESFFVNSLVPSIDALYPTIPTREKRAISGLSMGGQGAMYLAIRHPEIFGAVGSMSGGVDIRKFPNNWKMKNWLGTYEQNAPEWEKRAIVNLVDSLEPGKLAIIFDCGVDDFFAQVNDDLHNRLVEKKIPHDYVSRPGKHNWPYWRNSLRFQMLFFKNFFDK